MTPFARRPVAVLEVLIRLLDLPGRDFGHRDEVPRPGQRHARTRKPRHLGGSLRGGEAGVAALVEQLEARQPDVRDGKSFARTCRLEDLLGPLELLARQVWALQLPDAPAEQEPVACRLHLQAGGLEVTNALLEQRPRGGRFEVLPKSVGRSAHEAPALHRVGHMRGGALEELGGVLVGTSCDGRLGRSHAHSHRLLEVAGHQQVVREVDGLPAGLRFEDLSDAGVELLPARNDDVLIDGFARERVTEHIASGRAVGLLEQLVVDTRLERRQDGGAAPACDRCERRQVKGLADRGGGRQDLDVVRAEAADADQDGVTDRARHADLVYCLAVPSLVGLEDVAAVDGVAQELLEHEGVA
ncbi:MAG: hypothetical protein E6J12_10235, partial [Chloroflexi bacterium]